MTFTWQGRRLATASANGKSLSFKYNSDGIRTQKTVNGVTTYFTLDGSKIISQKTGNQEIFFEYDAQGNVATMIYNGQTYHYVRNLTGEILGLTDNNGNMVAEYFYDPWGEIIDYYNFGTFDLANLNPFKYKSYYYDSELGFYYLNSRYYDPVTSRFINADGQIAGVGGEILGYNMFAYCFNNPINMDDPIGNWPNWSKKFLTAAAIVVAVAVVAVVTVYTAGAGTAIAAAAVGAAKGAAIGFAVGAATGAASGAINHRVTTGSWKGSGEAALNGMADGALRGSINGAMTGGVSGAIGSTSTPASPKVDPRITDALKKLDETGIRPGQTQISQSAVLSKFNSYNHLTASSSYTQINGSLYVSEGHHTMIANVMTYGRLNTGIFMGQMVNDPDVVTNMLWTTLKIMP